MIETMHNKPYSQKRDTLALFVFAARHAYIAPKGGGYVWRHRETAVQEAGDFIGDKVVNPNMLNSLLGAAMRAKKRCVQIIRTHVKNPSSQPSSYDEEML